MIKKTSTIWSTRKKEQGKTFARENALAFRMGGGHEKDSKKVKGRKKWWKNEGDGEGVAEEYRAYRTSRNKYTLYRKCNKRRARYE